MPLDLYYGVMTNTSYFHPTIEPIPGDAIMMVREHMATMTVDEAVYTVAGEWGNVDPTALRAEVVKVFPVPTTGCKRYGHHFNPTTHHCNRCTELEPVDTDRVLTKHGFKARRVTEAQESALDSVAGSYEIDRVNVLSEDFGLAVVAFVDGAPAFIITQVGQVAPLS